MFLLLSGNSTVQLNIGDFLAFLSGISWAIGAAMIKRFDNVPLTGMTLCQFVVTALGALLIGFMIGSDDPMTLAQSLPVLPMISLVSIGIMLPVLLAIFWAQKRINPGRVGLLMMSEVLVAVISASILQPEERMTLIEWGGAVLIIGACLIEVLAISQPQPSISVMNEAKG